MLPGRLEARRPAGEPIERNAGQEIDDRPQARLRQRPAQGGKDNRQERLNDPLRRVGEQRRRGSDRAAQRKQRMRARRPRQPVDADQADQNQDRLADEPQDQRASDRDLGDERQVGVRGHGGAEFGHMPVGANRQQQVEQEGDRDQAQRLDQPQAAKAADERQDRTAGVDDQRDRRSRRIEPKDIRPRSGQLPEAERVIAIEGEDRERRGVNRDQRRGIWALGARPAQERQSAGAGDRGDNRLAQRDRGIEGERKQRRAAEPRQAQQAGAQKGVRKEPSSPCLSCSPNRPCSFLADCSTESQAPPSPLAGRPIAAQYGVYAHSCGYNSATVSRAATGEEAHDRSTTGRVRSCGRSSRRDRRAGGGTALAARAQPTSRSRRKPAKTCNVAGSPGVLAANGVCVRFSGYVSSQFGAGQLK